jgi:hypothetical protein
LKQDGRLKNEGKDICTWPAEFYDDGRPKECIPFDCIEDSIRKIKWIEDAIPPECP